MESPVNRRKKRRLTCDTIKKSKSHLEQNWSITSKPSSRLIGLFLNPELREKKGISLSERAE